MPVFYKNSQKTKISVFICAIFLIFNLLPARADESAISVLEIVPASAPEENIAPATEINSIPLELETETMEILPETAIVPVSDENNQIIVSAPITESEEEAATANNLFEIIKIEDESTIASDIIEQDIGTGDMGKILEENDNAFADDKTETQASSAAISDQTAKLEIFSMEIPDSESNTKRITSGIIRDITPGRLALLANWQMPAEKENNKYSGTDDSTIAGAQILPSGAYEVNKNVAVCALIADKPENNARVFAKISCPKTDCVKTADTEIACSLQKRELTLSKLDSEEASALVCDKIRNKNNNLLIWSQDKINDYTYAYEQVCGQAGILAQGRAEVYCAENAWAYNDPAGEYEIAVKAENNCGQADTSGSNLKYLELTMFENDFTDVQYGPVGLNEWQALAGDMVWGSSTAPTVRNTGNTPLKIKIRQNDFGFGKSGPIWNIFYKANVGVPAAFTEYLPEQTVILSNILNIGAMANMDFSVSVKQFPTATGSPAWSGELFLSAEKI